MFTGIVEELGTVAAPAPRLRVRCSTVLSDLTEGASISVNGVCLTALNVTPGSFEADVAPETLRRIRHAIIGREGASLRDDATALLVEWRSGSEYRLLPPTTP